MFEKFFQSDGQIQYDSLDNETDFEVNEIDASKEKLIYGIYQKVRSFVFYYNAEKEKSRRKADRWAIIGVIIFGFLVFVETVKLPIDTWFAILILELSVSMCIFASWFKECFILHGNIRVYYDVLVRLEEFAR